VSALARNALLDPEVAEVPSGEFRDERPPEVVGSGYGDRCLTAAEGQGAHDRTITAAMLNC
jgi:hypothetical protein